MKWRQIALGSITLAAFASSVAWSAGDGDDRDHEKNHHNEVHTATPIKHLVVIYGENVSFDHYFATYPHATNPSGEPAFKALPGTPGINGLSGSLLTSNPNLNPDNGTSKSNPFRLDRTQSATADQNHAYTAEQQAYDNGAADLFPKYTGKGTTGGAGAFGTAGQVMGYFDGNTVTALWNYAQRFAMSDNAYTSTYGPSTPGALEVVSGQTNGMKAVLTTKQPSVAGSYYVNDGQGGFTMINDVDPANDLCSSTTDTALMSGTNIGDLLNARDISWGGFMGGFNLATTNSNGTTGCKRSTLSNVVGSATADYIPHHNWFQYYASTSNPKHLRPSSLSAVGHSTQKDGHTQDPANHQYDTDDFFDAVKAGNFPAVNFLKAPAYQDGHAGYSDPLDEQAFVTKVVNFLQQQKEWESTAVIVAWDDSDGWYDHAYAMPTSASYDSVADQLNGPGICGTGSAFDGVKGKPVNGRCGPGTRIPFIVISPWAKENFVDHTLIDQSSVVRFIEDNWLDGRRIGGGSFDAGAGSIMGMFDFNRRGESHYPRKLFLNPDTGLAVETPPRS
ncbi:phospholipase C [Paraburkholderia azotifigens]|uniref:Alkaline phosphatase family protein n=1 Tax=Paraburkholderia azotifigens TaxID=2057004 RepID=A0A5C6VDC3_9BURK|nr:alkaline phosphatase family protein [Paraburkholderia azotifigens]TXC83000.1 alkaline phosphatase family protein [Paraburkholderia azotifigens]